MIVADLLTDILLMLQIRIVRGYPREWLLRTVEGRELECAFLLWPLLALIPLSSLLGYYAFAADLVLVLLILWRLLVYRSGY